MRASVESALLKASVSGDRMMWAGRPFHMVGAAITNVLLYPVDVCGTRNFVGEPWVCIDRCLRHWEEADRYRHKGLGDLIQHAEASSRSPFLQCGQIKLGPHG